MRLHLAFALLVVVLVAVVAWVIWVDSFPEWRSTQRRLVRREIARLEAELDSARAEVGRPEVRFELERLAGAIAAADTSAPIARLTRVRARLDGVQAEVARLRRALREADRRMREPATALRRRVIAERLADAGQAYARATGAWPPDTLRLGRLWARRDSLAAALIAIEGPVQAMKDSLRSKDSEAQALRIEGARLTSARDSLRALRLRILDPVRSRESALARLRRQTPRVREILSAGGGEPARCPTCHGAMDDAPGIHPALPAAEVFRDVPCTACHLGHGRALTAKEAHRGLVAAGDFAAGPSSVPARIERLLGADLTGRARAREELTRLAGEETVGEVGDLASSRPDSAIAAAWIEWWKTASAYFDPGVRDAPDREGGALRAAGIDPFAFSARGRALRYVGSRKCLSCHEVQHREHSRRWMATKFRSLERLAGEKRPERCFPCHTTGYDPATGSYAEPGVTCEACHGPGERYDEMMVVGQELLGKGDELRGRALLDISSRLARDAVNRRMVVGIRGEANVCVSCHHPWQHREGGPAVLDRPAPAAPLGTNRPRTGG